MTSFVVAEIDAETRAEVLLGELFGKKALTDYQSLRYIFVKDQVLGWKFRIHVHGVIMYQPSGYAISLCVGAVDPGGYGLPPADKVITLAMMAKASPKKLLKLAGDGGPAARRAWAEGVAEQEKENRSRAIREFRDKLASITIWKKKE